MSDTQKKQNFLQGTALLAMAAMFVKLVGALYKVPLNAIIGEKGFGYFTTAYEIYNILLMISTAGLPVAMSRMISESSSLGNYGQVRQIYTTARKIFLILGVSGSLLMTLFCRQLAAYWNQPDAWAAIGFLGPCVLFICVMSAYRGYFQGQSNMIPTAVSQVIEVIVKLAVGMLAAIALLRATSSIPLAAGGAILGVTASCIVSVFYLSSRFRASYRELPQTGDSPKSFRQTARELLKIAVPITLSSTCQSIITSLSSKIYMGRLLASGVTQEAADTMRGIHVMTQTIYNMPCALITPITVSIVPAITELVAQKKFREIRMTEESAIRVTGIFAMPCAVGLMCLAQPVTAFLGGYSGQKLALATQMMTVLGASIVFNALVLVTTAIMQAHGNVNRPVINMMIGGILKLIVVYYLTGNPAVGIVGTPIGTLLSYVVICILNVQSIHSLVEDSPRIVKNLFRPLLAACVMGIAVWLCWRGMAWLPLPQGLTGRALEAIVPVGVGAVVYLFAAVKFQVLTREDCLLLPKGEKIAKLLKL
ncbi:MAG: polysaccharide biosynthesis C-terminal domain-containing protein [Faecousia sp.]